LLYLFSDGDARNPSRKIPRAADGFSV
jgi:hypothetical protein